MDERTLGWAGVEPERVAVGDHGLGGASEATQQVGPGDVEGQPASELRIVGDRVD